MSNALRAIYDFLWAKQSSAICIRIWKVCKRLFRWWTGRHMIEHITRLQDENASWYLYFELVFSRQVHLTGSNPDATAESIIRAKATTSRAARLLRRRLIELLKEVHLFQSGVENLNYTRLQPIPLEHRRKDLDRAFDVVMGTAENRDFVFIGFQHKDPYGDFRGTGTIGLDHFIAFCTLHTEEMRTMVRESGSNLTADQAELTPWYSCGLASIHVTMLLIRRFNAGLHGAVLPRLLFQKCKTAHFQDLILQLHARTFIASHQYWLKKVYAGEVKSIMDFEACFRQFERSPEFLGLLQ